MLLRAPGLYHDVFFRERIVGCFALNGRERTMAGEQSGFTGKLKKAPAYAGVELRWIRILEIGSAYCFEKQSVTGEHNTTGLAVQRNAAGCVPGRMKNLEIRVFNLSRSVECVVMFREIRAHLLIGFDCFGSKAFENVSACCWIIRSDEREVRRMKENVRSLFAKRTYNLCCRCYVIQVAMRKENRTRGYIQNFQSPQNTLRLGSGIYDNALFFGNCYDVGVGMQWSDYQAFNHIILPSIDACIHGSKQSKDGVLTVEGVK